MDNLINILVAVIIIYSFLSPLFKQKKGTGAGSAQSGRKPGNPGANQKPSYSRTDYDILTEIEEMMNRGKNPPVINLPQDQDVAVENIEVRRMPVSSKKIAHPKKTTQYEYQKFKISEDERMNLERDLEKQFTSQRKVFHNPTFARVKSSFLNKADFKNGFIMSEILGKPKALRR